MSDNTETYKDPQEAPQEISREVSRDAGSRESTPRETTREGYAPRQHGAGYGQGYSAAGQPGAPAEGGTQTQYGTAPRRMDPSGRRPYGQGGQGGQGGQEGGGFRRYPSGGDRGGDRGDRGDRRSGGRRGSFRREKQDKIAAEKLVIDYKHPEILKRFLTEKGKILSRYITGNSAKNQRRLMREIKRARFVGLLPSA